MRFPGLIVGVLLLAWSFPAGAADRVFEFGLVVCQQQALAAPVVVLSSVQSSELVVPVATLDLPPGDSLPPDEGRACADVLTDLTRDGYALAASTPISRRAPPPEDIFLRRKPSITERLEWTIQRTNSVALLSCEPLTDMVASFADGASPAELSVPQGSSCAVYLAAMLALGGEIIARHAVTPPGSAPPAGPVTVYTAYELIRTFPAPDQSLPHLPRPNKGRDRQP
jgi:hypothetical protein